MSRQSKWESIARANSRYSCHIFLVRKEDGYVCTARSEEMLKSPFYRCVETTKDWKGVCKALQYIIYGEIHFQNMGRAYAGGAQDIVKFAEGIEERILKLKNEITLLDGKLIKETSYEKDN